MRHLALFVLIMSASASAQVDTTFNLSGSWTISCKDPVATYQLAFKPTKLKVGASNDSYYRIEGDKLGKMEVVGAYLFKSTHPQNPGYFAIAWHRLVSDLHGGIRLDGESSLILRTENNGETLILGGDFEKEELCVMTRQP
jgi:hypothetical protein